MKTSSSDLLLRALYREQQTLDNIHRSPTVSNMANTMFIHNVIWLQIILVKYYLYELYLSFNVTNSLRFFKSKIIAIWSYVGWIHILNTHSQRNVNICFFELCWLDIIIMHYQCPYITVYQLYQTLFLRPAEKLSYDKSDM